MEVETRLGMSRDGWHFIIWKVMCNLGNEEEVSVVESCSGIVLFIFRISVQKNYKIIKLLILLSV